MRKQPIKQIIEQNKTKTKQADEKSQADFILFWK
jgi:hypothetical protein